jgi:hypothetical protein
LNLPTWAFSIIEDVQYLPKVARQIKMRLGSLEATAYPTCEMA